ncbi:MAG: Fic family protein [Euryarchaeota archaeon]|nr:Fic family protein [Euryarchaeota archaeon]
MEERKIKEYRLERQSTEDGKESFYLVKDVRVKNLKGKVTKYIGSKEPNPEELNRLRIEHSSDLEIKAIEKKTELAKSAFIDDRMLPEKRSTLIEVTEGLRFLCETFSQHLTTSEVEWYTNSMEIQYVNGTTSIEGNTLSFDQTRSLLNDNIMPENKSLREVNEVQNFRKVRIYRIKHKGKVDLNFIKGLHSRIVDNIDLESAGEFRRTDLVAINGCEFQLAPSILIESELEEALDVYYTKIEDGHSPFIEAVAFHHTFERIHPFTDGNGRTGREIFNYMLEKEGYPRLLFFGKDRDQYISALKSGDNGNFDDMVISFSQLMINQRKKIIEENIERVLNPSLKKGQTRLNDF